MEVGDKMYQVSRAGCGCCVVFKALMPDMQGAFPFANATGRGGSYNLKKKMQWRVVDGKWGKDPPMYKPVLAYIKSARQCRQRNGIL